MTRTQLHGLMGEHLEAFLARFGDEHGGHRLHSHLSRCNGFVVSADRSRFLLFGPLGSGEGLIADASGAVLRTLDLLHVGFNAITASPVGARFAVLRPYWSDRVEIVDAAGAAPAGVVLDMNTGHGEETDGALLTRLIPGTDEALILALESDSILRVDLGTGAVLGRMDSARGPLASRRREDGRFVIGHEDGMLLVVDPAGPTEVARISLGGVVSEVHFGATGTDVWARVEAAATDELVHVETSAGAVGVLGRLPLSGRGGERDLEGRTLAVDLASGRAAAISGETGVLELIDLTALAPLASVTVGPPHAPYRIALPPGAGRVVCLTRASSPRVEGFEFLQGALQSIWSVAVVGISGSDGTLALVADGDVLIVDLTAQSHVFTAGGLHAIDVASGAILDVLPIAFARSIAVSGDDIAFFGVALGSNWPDRVVAARFDGSRFVDVESYPLGFERAVPPVLLDR